MESYRKGFVTRNELAYSHTNSISMSFNTSHLHDFNLPAPFRFFNSQIENTLREFHSRKIHISVVYLYHGRV